MINYLIELAVVHSSLIGGYWLLLRNEVQYGKMRAYILGSTFLALSIPFLRLPNVLSLLFPGPVQGESIKMALPLSEFIVDGEQDAINFEAIGLIVYASIMGILLVRFFYSLMVLVKTERRSRYEKINNLYVRKVPGLKGSFTFFGWIFLDESITPDHLEYQAILRHEQAHVLLGHSYDLLLLELFATFFWWLPSAWFMRREIKKIHEFQADAYALTAYPIDLYSSILISSSLKSNGLSLASSFHDGLIIKRLKAMKQNVTKLSPWKLGTLAALSMILFILFACSEEINQDIKKMGEQSNAITFDQLPDNMQKELQSISEQLVFTKLDISENDDPSDIMKLQNLDQKLIYQIQMDKENHALYIALKKEGSNFDYIAEKAKMDGDVFTIVENAPSFPGGMTEYFKYIGSEMTYPVEARKNGVSGRVYVQFIVEKDGSVGEVQTVKGIGGGCDEEAVRVVLNSPKFNPGEHNGEPVRVRMVLPVIFQLSDEPATATGG